MEEILSTGSWRAVYTALKVIFIVLDALLFVGFLYALVKGLGYRPDLRVSDKSEKKVKTIRTAAFEERWRDVMKKFKAGTADSMRLAIIEADALSDSVLKEIGIEGEHMADRLSQLDPEDIETLDRLWRAHRLRNDLVHTPGFTLSAHNAEITLKDYEAFLREMKVLEE